MKKLWIGLVLVCLLAAAATTAAGCSGSSSSTNKGQVAPAMTAAPTMISAGKPLSSMTESELSSMRHSYGLDKPDPLSAVKSFFSDGTSSGGYSAPAGSAGSSVTWTNATAPAPTSTMQFSEGAVPDRMVVRTGNIQMVVNDISSAVEGVTRVAAVYNGYVVTSQRGKEGEKNVGSISIRIASANFDRALADLRALAKSVIFESTGSQDVTEEYVDLDAKVKNLEATEIQLRKIMEGAVKTEDILSIQRELTNVRGEIELVKGRMQYLERTSSTSLIQVQLEEAVLALKFTANKTYVDINEAIRFTPDVAGGFPPYAYQWDFGDGKTSNEVSPSHSYPDAGLYFVTLKVTDDKGYTNTLSRSPYINVKATWKPGNVASSAWNGFKAFGRVFVDILIWLGIFSPVWIVIGGIIWLVRRRRNRRKM